MLFICRAQMPVADIIEELRQISRRLRRAHQLFIGKIHRMFFLRNWIVNNARRSTSMHHDKTLQMNIDNGACLFLTAIYNGTWHYLRMITKTSSAQVNHIPITISLSQAARMNTSRKKASTFFLMVTLDARHFSARRWSYIMILHVVILAYIFYVSVWEKHFNPR